MKLSLAFLLALIVLMEPTTVQAQFFVFSSTASDVSINTPVEFQCTFTNLWTAARHPIDYPASAHWSEPVLAAHSDSYQMWAPGTMASPGVELVAETGGTSTLVAELDNSMETGAYVVGMTTFNSQTQQQTFDPLALDSSYPFISTITMIAPSSDWFAGFHDFAAFSGASWYSNFAIESFPMDAGTETGTTYSIGNPAQVPPLPMFELTTATVPDTGLLLNPDQTAVLPVARWQCTLLMVDDTPTDPPILTATNPPASTAPSTDEPTGAPVMATEPPTMMMEPAPTDPPATELPTSMAPTDPPTDPPAVSTVPPTSTNGGSFSIVSTTASATSIDETVEYECVLTNLWTAATHPINYPSGSAHWSPPVLVTHNGDYEMWAPMALASAGVESVAETGRTSTLEGEIAAAGMNVLDTHTGSDQFNSDNAPQTFERLSISADHPFMTAISMVAPSSDWFSGFYNFSPISASSTWYSEFTIETYPFDAGTEEGNDFTLGNPPTDPQQLILQLTVNTVPDNGVLLSPDGTTVLPMASWGCTLRNDPDTSAGVSRHVGMSVALVALAIGIAILG